MLTKEQYKEYSRKEFDEAAKTFENQSVTNIYSMCKEDYPDILAELEKEPFTYLLDAGCGTGAVIYLLKQKYPDKYYTGIDLSSKMIEVANKKALPNVKFIQGDCENLPFNKNSFDVVTCSQSFHHYPTPENFFKSVYNVLKPNGRLILRDMTAGKYITKLINAVEFPIANNIFHKGDVKIYTKEDIQRLCNISGLTLELFEQRKGFRLHCVCRKSK